MGERLVVIGGDAGGMGAASTARRLRADLDIVALEKGEYTSYDIGVSAGMKGKFRAPFAGTQGWYWRNDGTKPVTVTVKAKGTWANFVVVPLKK